MKEEQKDKFTVLSILEKMFRLSTDTPHINKFNAWHPFIESF